MAQDSESSENKKIIDTALARFKLSEDAENENRRLALDDLNFLKGEQWAPEERQRRELDRRPCLVINRLPNTINQITNDQRQNRPSIKVHPVDDGADIETAKIIQGMIRHIEYNSCADAAYDTAFESAVRGGRGYWRVITNYVTPTSFDQEILIKRIRNPFSVFFDPYSQEPDGSDANYAFVIEDISKEEYKRLYLDSVLTMENDWDAVGNRAPGWASSESARVAEYFYKDFKSVEMVLLNTGETVQKDQIPEVLPEGIQVVKERMSQVAVIKWVKMNAVEVLEMTDWMGTYIPVIPVYGTEYDIDGTRFLEGVVRNAKDPARAYNYWTSAQTEAIALAPRAPYIAAEGQIEGYEDDWANANNKNLSTLIYKPTSIAGIPVAPPQRNAVEPAVQAITQARMMATDDIKATTGIYDASLGAASNETSGVAIQRRNNQALTSNFHFVDNLTRSQRHTGRILVDLIPKIYDTPRIARVVTDENEQKIVRVNDPTFVENGKATLYALDAGKYDVTIDTGPSYQTKREEAVASMLEMTRSVPQIGAVAADLMVKNMDWPGAQEVAERIKKTLPPNLVDDPKNKQPLPPDVQAKMDQMSQMVSNLSEELHKAMDEKEKKVLEIESNERIAFKKLEVQVEIEMAKLGAKDSIELLNHEIAQINQRLQLLQIQEPVEDESPQQEAQESYSTQNTLGANGAGSEMAEHYPTGGQSPGLPLGENP